MSQEDSKDFSMWPGTEEGKVSGKAYQGFSLPRGGLGRPNVRSLACHKGCTRTPLGEVDADGFCSQGRR